MGIKRLKVRNITVSCSRKIQFWWNLYYVQGLSQALIGWSSRSNLKVSQCIDPVSKIYNNYNDHPSIYLSSIHPFILSSIRPPIHLPIHPSILWLWIPMGNKVHCPEIIPLDNINLSSCNENLLFFSLFHWR